MTAGLVILGLSVSIISLLVWGGQGFKPLPTGFTLVPVGAAAVYVLVGGLLGARLPGNPVGWIFLAVGLVMTMILPVELLVAQANEALRPASTLTVLAAWLSSSFTMPSLIALLAIAGLVFPDGRFLSPGWRRLAGIIAVAAASLALAVGLDPSGLLWYPTLPNPFAAPASLSGLLSVLRGASLVVLLVCIGGVIVALATRYQSGDRVTRVQLRWIVFAAMIQSVALVVFVFARYVIEVSEAAGEMLGVMAQVALVSLPLAAAFAITRYRLYGIDVLISRTLVYVPLMGALGGLYALAVTVFQRLFVALTGGTSDVALLIAVFLIAATFTPLRKALEGAVDRWAQASLLPGSTAAASGSEVDDLELRRTAAQLISLRRLEERLTANMTGDADGPRRSLAIDAAGFVACPAGNRPTPFAGCLGCPHLVAIITAPPQVDCGYRATA